MKTKWLAIGIILLFVGVTIAPAIAQNTEKSQSSRGNWLYVGGSGPGNYSIIQDAVNNASNGDTVFVYSGVYNRSTGVDYCVYLNKSISLVGENKNTTILSGWWKSAVVEVVANNVEVKGFTIQNLKQASGIGMSLHDIPPNHSRIENVTIHDNIFMNNTLDGLEIIWCINLTCYDNIFKENAEKGCYVIATGYSSITHNLFIKNGIGIYVGNSARIEVSQNEFKENENGLYNSGLEESNELRCLKNNFINNTIQANFYIDFCLLAIPGMVIYRAQWRHNYWSDWGHIIPRPIKGTLFYSNALFSYALTMTIPWAEFDWFPAKEPYEIPGMS